MNINELCGWIPRPAAVQAELDRMAKPRFADAAPHLMNTDDGKSNVCLWNACIKVTGKNLAADKQGIGDCVSHGNGRGIDYLQCIQIAIGNQENEFIDGVHSVMTEVLYGESREIGNDLGEEDGSTGIWAVKALKEWGFVPRQNKPYSANTAKSWGRTGTPNEYKEQGRVHLLQDYAHVTSLQEADNALFNGYPVPVCSNQGFTMSRDQNGICEAQGTWGHCMLCIGRVFVLGEKFYTILQSWGQNTPSGPTILAMPDNSFNIRASIFDRMIAARDTWALSSISGFPHQADRLNFLI